MNDIQLLNYLSAFDPQPKSNEGATTVQKGSSVPLLPAEELPTFNPFSTKTERLSIETEAAPIPTNVEYTSLITHLTEQSQLISNLTKQVTALISAVSNIKQQLADTNTLSKTSKLSSESDVVLAWSLTDKLVDPITAKKLVLSTIAGTHSVAFLPESANLWASENNIQLDSVEIISSPAIDQDLNNSFEDLEQHKEEDSLGDYIDQPEIDHLLQSSKHSIEEANTEVLEVKTEPEEGQVSHDTSIDNLASSLARKVYSTDSPTDKQISYIRSTLKAGAGQHSTKIAPEAFKDKTLFRQAYHIARDRFSKDWPSKWASSYLVKVYKDLYLKKHGPQSVSLSDNTDIKKLVHLIYTGFNSGNFSNL